jgi:hypothetical protein
MVTRGGSCVVGWGQHYKWQHSKSPDRFSYVILYVRSWCGFYMRLSKFPPYKGVICKSLSLCMVYTASTVSTAMCFSFMWPVCTYYYNLNINCSNFLPLTISDLCIFLVTIDTVCITCASLTNHDLLFRQSWVMSDRQMGFGWFSYPQFLHNL